MTTRQRSKAPPLHKTRTAQAPRRGILFSKLVCLIGADFDALESFSVTSTDGLLGLPAPPGEDSPTGAPSSKRAPAAYLAAAPEGGLANSLMNAFCAGRQKTEEENMVCSVACMPSFSFWGCLQVG